MELGDYFYICIVTSNPETGEAVDADTEPTIDVFEEDNDTPIYTDTMIKRTGLDGQYRIKIEVTEANGFSADRVFSGVCSATVAGVEGKTIAFNFKVMSNVKVISSTISPLSIPDSFEPDMYLYPEPEEVDSMDEQFGENSGYEYATIFITYYDQAGKVWTTDSEVTVPLIVRSDVAAHQALLDAYEEDYAAWLREKEVQREIQWRIRIAKRLIEWAAAHES